jgi:hypothetical protein
MCTQGPKANSLTCYQQYNCIHSSLYFWCTNHAQVFTGKQEWLASINGAALPQSGVVHYTAAIHHNGDKLKQHIHNLPDWAAPPNQFLQQAIKAATSASNIKWDPMDKEGPSITLNFNSKQLWMAKPHPNVHISYKTISTTPPFSH